MSGVRQASRRSPLLVVIPIFLFVVVFVVARLAGNASGGSQDDNPFLDRPPLVVTGTAGDSAISTASGDDRQLLERLAGVPQATWLTPEAHSVEDVGRFVAKIAADGEAAGRTPVFVVYGITDRDCSGGHSSGGLPPDQYARWVDRISGSIGDDGAVILEPDALATAAECGTGEARTDLLRAAVTTLTAQGATVYLDAGHANWTAPGDMAAMLEAAGVGDARGFSTNVAGYESTDDETVYAQAVSDALGGAHYVTDTGRNGRGSNGEWCNPAGRALGREPAASSDGALDAYLWIKPPGESDGTCGGGPVAGAFWTERAISLARAAGW